MATNVEVPAWAKEFEVVIGEETIQEVKNDFTALLDEQKISSFTEGEVYPGTVISVWFGQVLQCSLCLPTKIAPGSALINNLGTLLILKNSEYCFTIFVTSSGYLSIGI